MVRDSAPCCRSLQPRMLHNSGSALAGHFVYRWSKSTPPDHRPLLGGGNMADVTARRWLLAAAVAFRLSVAGD